jgi:glycosyltransferase involved in cell wall biosynthesis
MVEAAVDKKVCLVTWGHDALDDRIFFKEAWSLRKVYGRVSILAVGHKREQRVGGVRVVVVKRHAFSPWTMWRMYLAARGERAYLYHLHEPQLLPLGLVLKILYHAKIIYDVHEHLPEMIRDFSARPKAVAALLAASFSLVDKLLVRCADAVLVTTNLLVSRYTRISRRVVAIYNYPRTDLFAVDHLPPAALRRKYKSCRVVLYHGQIGKMRNVPLLIRATKLAAQKIRGLKLLLLGPVFGHAYRDQLLQLLRCERADGLVELLDPIPHYRVPDYIALSQVGLVILPPLSVFRKNIPIKLFEYMACGIPVVGSRLPPIERFIRPANCGLLVDPTDSREIARAIVRLLEHPDEARAMGLRGQKAIEERYNWSQMEARLLGIYRELEGKPC